MYPNFIFMKSLNEMMYGADYTNKLSTFNTRLEEIKENYQGEFDTNEPMYTMQTHQTKGEVRIDIDKQVPEDLKVAILNCFNDVWKN